jgi:hypothetical protein
VTEERLRYLVRRGIDVLKCVCPADLLEGVEGNLPEHYSRLKQMHASLVSFCFCFVSAIEFVRCNPIETSVPDHVFCHHCNIHEAILAYQVLRIIPGGRGPFVETRIVL